MNILLISVQQDLDIIGLKYLHYYLRDNGYHSFLLHLPKFNPDNRNMLENIGKFVLEINPGFIGISLMSLEYFNSVALTKHLKTNLQATPVIWGGVHPTISPKECLDYADYVSIGESENTVLDIANAICDNKDIKTINNLCYKENGQLIKNRLYPYIEDLDRMPLYDHVPVNGFIQEDGGRIIALTKKVFIRNARYRGSMYNIMTSRGCPFSCTYCCNNFLSSLYETKKIRRRSIPNIISELEKAVKDNPGLAYINFADDCFLSWSNEHIREFSEIYKERIKKPFLARGIPIYINREKMKYLKDAGMGWIEVGLQSGSDRICKEVYKRRSLQSDFLKAAEIIKEFRVAAFYDIILDNPFESEEERLEAVETFMRTPKPFYTQFFSLSLFLGTELYERVKKERPEWIEDSRQKNYYVYDADIINDMIRLSAFLSRNFMQKIVDLYKKNPKGLRFKAIVILARLWSMAIVEPLTYFSVIRLSQNGSFLKTLKVLPIYLQEGLMRYFIQLKTRSSSAKSSLIQKKNF